MGGRADRAAPGTGVLYAIDYRREHDAEDTPLRITAMIPYGAQVGLSGF
jgi:hypothetical protein